MDDCIFCRIVRGEAESWKVYETERVLAFLDINPINPYHTLIIPKAHYTDIFDTPEEELREVISVVKRLADLYRQKLGIENVQVINCSGEEAQQEVFHVHFHIAPRHAGDGQDIRWRTHPEMRARFDEMLAGLGPSSFGGDG
jgi:histidine triad (HIT) family protein